MQKGIKENTLLVTASTLSERWKQKLKMWLMRACEGKQPTTHTKPTAGGSVGGDTGGKGKNRVCLLIVLILQPCPSKKAAPICGIVRSPLMLLSLLMCSPSRAEVLSPLSQTPATLLLSNSDSKKSKSWHHFNIAK